MLLSSPWNDNKFLQSNFAGIYILLVNELEIWEYSIVLAEKVIADHRGR
jgi:hypothetical protein